jgi:carboxyl-terminal processing protease
MNQQPTFTRPRPVLFYLVCVFAFLAGIAFDRSGWLRETPYAPRPELRQTFAPFWEAWNLVDRYYVDREAVQPVKMTRGAIQGMLNSLGDTGHTAYLSPDEVKELVQSLQGHFEGIGARMTVRKGRPTVVAVLPDSPALTAGLKSGDVLLEVDSKDVSSMSLNRIVQMVRGPANTRVHLRVQRSGTAQPLDFEIERRRVKINDVSWHLLPGTQIAHVGILEFGEKTDQQLRTAIEQAKQSGAKGLIVDVRGNPGGLRDQAVAVTSEFLKSGVVFIQQDADGKRTEVPVKPGGLATDLPLVVLIDEGTASSAEILAGAVQDHERGKLVGTKTFGTGTVLGEFPLNDGSALLLAIAEWFTPKGRQIWHQGIDPDVEVTLPTDAQILLPDNEAGLTPDELQKSEDKQLLRALKVLEDQLREQPKARIGTGRDG